MIMLHKLDLASPPHKTFMLFFERLMSNDYENTEGISDFAL